MTLAGEKKLRQILNIFKILLCVWPALEMVLMNFHCPKAKTFSQAFLQKSWLLTILGKIQTIVTKAILIKSDLKKMKNYKTLK